MLFALICRKQAQLKAYVVEHTFLRWMVDRHVLFAKSILGRLYLLCMFAGVRK